MQSRHQQILRNTDRYGKGEVQIDDLDGAFVDETLCAALGAAIDDENWRPPTLPRVALEILALSQKQDVSLDEVLKLLEEDAMIAARVFRIAQSPVYAGTSPITSMRQALVRLGVNGVRDLVIEASLQTKIFRHPTLGHVLSDVWTHSRRVAYLSRHISQHLPFDADLAFMTGLLHDVGMAGALLLAAENGLDKETPLPLLLGAAASLHHRAGARMVTKWSLPMEVSFAIRAHHVLHDEGFANPHAAILILAEGLEGGTANADSQTPPALIHEAAAVLGFDAAQTDKFVDAVPEILASID